MTDDSGKRPTSLRSPPCCSPNWKTQKLVKRMCDMSGRRCEVGNISNSCSTIVVEVTKTEVGNSSVRHQEWAPFHSLTQTRPHSRMEVDDDQPVPPRTRDSSTLTDSELLKGARSRAGPCSISATGGDAVIKVNTCFNQSSWGGRCG